MGCSTSALKRLATPVFSPTAHSAGLLSVLLVAVSLRCVFDVSAVSVISPPFSRFMVSPRKKYSFRSVILNVVKDKNSHHHIQPFVHSPFAAGFYLLISLVASVQKHQCILEAVPRYGGIAPNAKLGGHSGWRKWVLFFLS